MRQSAHATYRDALERMKRHLACEEQQLDAVADESGVARLGVAEEAM
jgi:hypothetical protein